MVLFVASCRVVVIVQLSFVHQHRGVTTMFQHREALLVGCIELMLQTNAGERTRWDHERRLLQSGVSMSKSRRAPVWVPGARGETHIHRRFPSLNPGLESCGEFWIEVEGGPHAVLVFDVFHDVLYLGTILAPQMTPNLLSEHLPDAGLAYVVDGGVLELIRHFLPLMTRAPHRLHLRDTSCNVDVESLDDVVAEIHRGGTNPVEDAGELACRCSHGSNGSSSVSCAASSESHSSNSSLRTMWCL